jgi:hypothetical protein
LNGATSLNDGTAGAGFTADRILASVVGDLRGGGFEGASVFFGTDWEGGAILEGIFIGSARCIGLGRASVGGAEGN